MPEVALVALRDRGRELLNALEAAARGVLPFRTSDDGRRSYAAKPDHLAAVLERLEPGWQEDVARASGRTPGGTPGGRSANGSVFLDSYKPAVDPRSPVLALRRRKVALCMESKFRR